MMRLKKITLLSFLTLMIICLVIPYTHAYVTTGYKLIGGVKDRMYYVDGGYHNVLFNDIATAVGYWNAINPTSSSTTDVSFTLSGSTSNSQVHFYTSDYGNIGWYGSAYYYTSSGVINPGWGPTQNYIYSQVRMNRYSGYDNDRKNTWTAIAAHEMGHALGLLHEDRYSTIMNTNLAEQTSPTSLSNDDIAGIRSLY